MADPTEATFANEDVRRELHEMGVRLEKFLPKLAGPIMDSIFCARPEHEIIEDISIGEAERLYRLDIVFNQNQERLTILTEREDEETQEHFGGRQSRMWGVIADTILQSQDCIRKLNELGFHVTREDMNGHEERDDGSSEGNTGGEILTY